MAPAPLTTLPGPLVSCILCIHAPGMNASPITEASPPMVVTFPFVYKAYGPSNPSSLI